MCSRFWLLVVLLVVARRSRLLEDLARGQRSDGRIDIVVCLANRDWCEAGMRMKLARKLYAGISTRF
jgi:hypothetical protein